MEAHQQGNEMNRHIVAFWFGGREGLELGTTNRGGLPIAMRLIGQCFVGFLIGALPPVSALGDDRAEALSGTKVSPAAKPFGRSKSINARGMLKWAASLSHRSIPDGIKPPALIATDEGVLAAMVCPGDPEACSSVAAAYSLETREIRYRASFDLHDIEDRSYIVHEMVHFLQHLDQRISVTKTCQQIFRNEREAYSVQAAYLRRHGSIHAYQVFPRMVACQPADGEMAIE